MPTYEYLCKACGHALEIFHSMSEAPKKKCPACGKPKLERQISAGAGVVFKGSGFYQTDYRSDSYKSAAKADSEGSKPASGDAAASASKAGDGKPSEAKSSEPKAGDATPKKPAPSAPKAGGDARKPTRSDG